MKTFTQKQLIAAIPDDWARHYENRMNKALLCGRTAFEVYTELRAASPLTKNIADSIIGSEDWTKLVCEECSQEVPAVVCLVENADTGYWDASVCQSCLSKALHKICNLNLPAQRRGSTVRNGNSIPVQNNPRHA